MKTAWRNVGSAENTELQAGLLLKAVASEGVDNFHKGCIWQIAVSKNSSIQESEVLQWYLTSDTRDGPDTKFYGNADLNVSQLNTGPAANELSSFVTDNLHQYVLTDSGFLEKPGTDPIDGEFWQIDQELTRRDDSTRTW